VELPNEHRHDHRYSLNLHPRHAVFCSGVADDDVLFQSPVTRTWLRQAMLGLTLICRSSYRGVREFMRVLLGVSVSVGRAHDVQQWAAQQAGAINRG
jgi:hypothetical protein